MHIDRFATGRDHFFHGIREGKEPGPPSEENLPDVCLDQQIDEAARAGGPIQLS